MPSINQVHAQLKAAGRVRHPKKKKQKKKRKKNVDAVVTHRTYAQCGHRNKEVACMKGKATLELNYKTINQKVLNNNARTRYRQQARALAALRVDADEGGGCLGSKARKRNE